ncbi:MAG: enoyl-CoA hydratase-related protein [Actinomycetota bacterium]|nr:enoyl-CoA hydratase-related protein [Actinomycetota bacterium]
MTTHAQELVSMRSEGRVAVVTLNRPGHMNAISGALADRLAVTFQEVARDSETWAVVLTAAGETAFCAGADLKERRRFSLEDFQRNRTSMRSMFGALRELPQPSIASTFGFALGGGFELALSCDLTVASEDTVFGLPEARVGLFPAGGATQLLTRAAGPRLAKEMIFTGRRFDAQRAKEIGLVVEVVGRADLAGATMALAEEICRVSPVAVREAKGVIDAALGAPLGQGLELENDAWRRTVQSDDRAEGIAAFNDKREPRWRNR